MSIMEKTLVSIIISCYNSEKYLPAMIECLLRKTYHNFEAVLVDGCIHRMIKSCERVI